MGGQPHPGARTHFLLQHTGEAAGRAVGRGPGLLSAASAQEAGRRPRNSLPAAGRMEDEEGPQCGKPDFVLLDQVTMEDFMENLKLRWARARAPFSLVSRRGGGGTHSHWPLSG